MAEEFHRWVANLSWWERLYYEIFNPDAIHCTTSYVGLPVWFRWVFVVCVALMVVGLIVLWRLSKRVDYRD